MKGLMLLAASFGAMAAVYLFFGIYLATHNPVFVVAEVTALFIQLGLLVSGAIIELRRF